MKYLLPFFFFLFVYSNIFPQNDTIRHGGIEFEDQNFYSRDTISGNYFSILPMRIFVGEFALFYERVNKKNRGTELGFGYIFNASNNTLLFLTGLTIYTGDYKLYGYSFYFSKKYYLSYNSLVYFSPEFIFRYEYNDDMNVLVDGYNDGVQVSQKRFSQSLSFKFGWRDNHGIVDFYLGGGIIERYVETKYLDNPTQYPSPQKIKYDNGWYSFPLLRIGMKIGFPF